MAKRPFDGFHSKDAADTDVAEIEIRGQPACPLNERKPQLTRSTFKRLLFALRGYEQKVVTLKWRFGRHGDRKITHPLELAEALACASLNPPVRKRAELQCWNRDLSLKVCGKDDTAEVKD